MYVDSLTVRTYVATGKLAERQDTALPHLQAGRRVVNVEAAHLSPRPLRQASSRADTRCNNEKVGETPNGQTAEL